MEIINNKNFNGSRDYEASSFVTTKELVSILENSPYKDELVKLFGCDEEKINIIQVGNSRDLLNSLKMIDNQCVKIDLISKMKDVQLIKMLESEKALFEVVNVSDLPILKLNDSDILEVESRYDAKNNILDYYNFAKFANYCRDNGYDDLVNIVKEDLKLKNLENEESRKLRLLYLKEDEKFYVRALVSDENYKDFGVNFSTFAALMSLSRYSESTGVEVYIANYQVNDSTIYLSFSFKENKRVGENMSSSELLVDYIYNNNFCYREGENYLRDLFECVTIYYIDKFGENELDEFIEKAFVWCYYLRFVYQRLGFDSLDNYVITNNLFLIIKNAIQPKDVIKAQILLLPTYQNIKDFSSDDSRRMDKRIVEFFKNNNYYAN